VCSPGSGWAGWKDIPASPASPHHARLPPTGIWSTTPAVPPFQPASGSPPSFQAGQQAVTVTVLAAIYHHVYDNQTVHKIMVPFCVTPCGLHEGVGEPQTS